jgi:hypothetical protein
MTCCAPGLVLFNFLGASEQERARARVRAPASERARERREREREGERETGGEGEKSEVGREGSSLSLLDISHRPVHTFSRARVLRQTDRHV